MKKEFIKLTLQLVVLTLILFGVQWFLTDQFMQKTVFYFPAEKIYLFHFFTTFIIVATLLLIKKIMPDKVGFTFMGFSILKMGASLFFLFPLSTIASFDPIPDVLAFFIPYFVFLFYETFYLVSLLNKDLLKNTQ